MTAYDLLQMEVHQNFVNLIFCKETQHNQKLNDVPLIAESYMLHTIRHVAKYICKDLSKV